VTITITVVRDGAVGKVVRTSVPGITISQLFTPIGKPVQTPLLQRKVG
jgi:hypothetical protein